MESQAPKKRFQLIQMDQVKKGTLERLNRWLIHKYDPVAMRRMDKDLKRIQVHLGDEGQNQGEIGILDQPGSQSPSAFLFGPASAQSKDHEGMEMKDYKPVHQFRS